MKKPLLPCLLVSLAILVVPSSTSAQQYSHARIVRLSFAEGTVQFQRPGQDWQQAGPNLPIEEGFGLRTADGYAEVEFEQSLTLRLGTNSTVEFSVLALLNGGRITRLVLSQGSAFVDAGLHRGDALVMATPQFLVNLPHDGKFRVDATSTESWVSVFHGKVSVDSSSGTQNVSSGRTLHQTAGGSEVAANPPQDDFDKWVARRDDAMSAAATQTQEVLGGAYTEGFADLFDYGLWDDIPGYGAGWVPYGMGLGWMPFADGQWMFMGPMGWNWVSAEPWGWVPYHFGSWVNAPGIGWAWLPTASDTWVPANATWVQVNNQLGWIPTGPPLAVSGKRGVAAPGTIPVAILAGGIGGAIITPRAHIALNQTGAILPAAAPLAPTSAAASAGPPLTARAFLPSGPSVRSPIGSVSRLRVAQLSAVPHAMMAPHALPAPLIARAAASSGFRGGFAGGGGFSAASSGAPSGFGGSRSAPVRMGASGGPVAHAGGSSGSGGAAGGHH